MVKRSQQAASDAAVGYIRVSTRQQAEEGISLDAQNARLQAYCAMRGLDLVAVVVDAAVSAAKYRLQEREGGVRALELLRSGQARHVVTVKLDRMFRDAEDALHHTKAWDKAGVSLHLTDLGGMALDTSSAMGRIFLTMMAGFAEIERNLIAERTAAALARKRKRGEKTGGNVPFGFDLQHGPDGKPRLVPNTGEQEAVTLMRSLRADGYSLRAIAAELDRRGIAPKEGQTWHGTQVARALNRAA